MRRLLALVVLCLFPLAALSAQELPAPVGPVVLTVSGAIAHSNVDGTAQFDQAMLDGLAQHSITSETPWYDSARTFSGVLVSSLLEAVGSTGTTLTVTALNGYSAEIPATDMMDSPVILASRVNDALLSVRDKGPLFVVYPFDSNPELFNEVYFGRSVWQVTAVAVN